MKIRPVGADLFHADRPTDRHDANSHFSQSANAPDKKCKILILTVIITMTITRRSIKRRRVSCYNNALFNWNPDKQSALQHHIFGAVRQYYIQLRKL